MYVNLQYVSKWLVQPGITLMNHSGMFKSSLRPSAGMTQSNRVQGTLLTKASVEL